MHHNFVDLFSKLSNAPVTMILISFTKKYKDKSIR